jgi:thioredoxin 2
MELLCPHCQSINRLPSDRLADSPRCGNCKKSLLTREVESVDDQQLSHHLQHNEVPILVDFWAPWCHPCVQFAPILSQVAAEFSTPMRFLKLDTEQCQQSAATFGIRSIPTLILFHRGKEVKRSSGALPKQQFIQWLQEAVRALT